ncbi:MAG: hypothetical protein IPL61_18335 [Myxococcales bacterium]|nr:hypothetical protein [Myxococcales bacterium]
MTDLDALEASLADDDRAMLDELADAIARRRLTSAAIFMLESMAPLGFLGSQLMIGLRPLVALVWTSPVRWDQVQRVLERRGAIELLLRRLEARA